MEMITFNLHIASIIVGLLLGYILCSVVLTIIFFNDNWDRGFGNGFEACRKYMERQYKESQNEVKESEKTEK